MILRSIKLLLISIVLSLGLLSPMLDGVNGSKLGLVFSTTLNSFTEGGFLLSQEGQNNYGLLITNTFGFDKAYANDPPRPDMPPKPISKKPSEDSTPDFSKSMLKFGEFIALILKPLMYFNWLFISLAGVFMDNTLIYDPTIADNLHRVWVVFRNLVNVIFVFTLIAAAIINLVKGKKLEDLGKSVGTIIISLVLVNFSWFFVKVVVDFGTVMTNVVFRLPFDFMNNDSAFIKNGKMISYIHINYKPDLGLIGDGQQGKKQDTTSSPGGVTPPPAATPSTTKKEDETDKFSKVFCVVEIKEGKVGNNNIDLKILKDSLQACEKVNKTPDGKLDKQKIYSCQFEKFKGLGDICNNSSSLGMQSVKKNKDGTTSTVSEPEKFDHPGMAMIVVFTDSLQAAIKNSKMLNSSSAAGSIALNYIPIQNLNIISSLTNSVGTMLFQLLVSIAIGIATVIIFIAFSAVMIERVFAIWLIAIASPFVALLYAIEGMGLKAPNKMGYKDIIGKLITYAVVIPVGVGAVFSFVFLIITQLFQVGYNHDDGKFNSFISNVGGAWDLILAIVVLYILWKLSFSIIKKADVVGDFAVKHIQGGVESFLKATGTNLSYIPLFPIAKEVGTENKLKASLSDISGLAGRGALGDYKDAHDKRGNVFELAAAYNASSKVDLNIKNEEDKLFKDNENVFKNNPDDKGSYQKWEGIASKSENWGEFDQAGRAAEYIQFLTERQGVKLNGEQRQKILSEIGGLKGSGGSGGSTEVKVTNNTFSNIVNTNGVSGVEWNNGYAKISESELKKFVESDAVTGAKNLKEAISAGLAEWAKDGGTLDKAEKEAKKTERK